MSQDINFLPEKDKEIKEKEQVKRAKPGVRFHTPKAEPTLDSQTEETSSFARFWETIQGVLGGVFNRKKKKTPSTPLGKQPAKLDKVGATSRVENTASKPTANKQPAQPAAPTQAPVSTASITGTSEGSRLDYRQLDVNLMPWEDPLLKRVKLIRIVIILFSILSVAIWGTMLRLQNSATQEIVDSLKSSIVAIDDQIKSVQGDLAGRSSVDIGHQQAFINLYVSLPRWSKFLTWLESRTHKQVSFTDVSATTNQVTLPVIAPDYETAVQQWLAFRNETDWAYGVLTSAFAGGTELDENNNELSKEVHYTIVFSLVEGVLELSPDDL